MLIPKVFRNASMLKRQRGFMLNPFRMAAAGDPFFSYVKLLLHGEGVDNSTSIVDSSLAAKTVTRLFGAVIGTEQFSVGTSSIDCTPDGACVAITPTSDMRMTGQFTFELSVRFSTVTPESHILSANTGGAAYWFLCVVAGNLRLRFNAVTVITGPAVSINTWYKIAITRDASNVVRFFVDGVLITSYTTTFSFASDPVWQVAGNTVIAGDAYGGNQWVDEVRLTFGVCRYTANYVPETTVFPDN